MGVSHPVALLAGVAMALGTIGTSSASTPPAGTDATSGSSEWIAYESPQWKIRLVHPDGTGDHLLEVETSGPQDNPDWSPDGSRLTFVGEGTDAGSNPGLWVVNSDGTDLRRVVECVQAECQYLDDPAWSPDGTEIMYAKQAPTATHGGELEVANVETGATRTILTAPPGELYSGVRYAPDGKSVVLELVHTTPPNYDNVDAVTLTRVDLAGESPTTTALTEPDLFAETPDWSPTGDYISYSALDAADSNTKNIYIVHPDGSGRKKLTSLSGEGGVHTDFTNDGSAVYFSAGTIQLVDIASGAVSLVGSGFFGFHPRTQPHG